MNIVGKKVVRLDGYEKVTGKAIYGDDIQLKNMLYMAQKYTDIPCGKIKSIDISKAEKLEGVVKIALHKDVIGQDKIGPIRQDQYVICKDRVYYSGDVVAVVSATSKNIANLATNMIEVEYEAEKGVFDITESAKDEQLVRPEYKTNVVVHYPLRKGDVEKGFADCDQVIEREYKTGFHEHGYIETESLVAVPDPTCNGVKVYGSVQNPHTTRREVAKFLGLKLNQVDVRCSNLGGSFGGKDDTVNAVACRVAMLTFLTGKPHKISLSREESMKESYKRHPYLMKYKVGFNNDGNIKSMKVDILADSGAYSAQSFFVTWRSVVQATGPYEIDNVSTDIKAVYTNNTYTAAYRGFGSPQIIFAQESLMDEIGELCGLAPMEVRAKNGYSQGSVTASGQILDKHKVSLSEVIKKATDDMDYDKKVAEYKKFNEENSRYKKGVGLACSFRGCALGAEGTDATSAIVSVQQDGSGYVWTGLNENGQGLRTTFSQVAAECLGMKYEDMHFLEPSTAAINDGGPTVASRGTLMGGNAILDAANKIKQRIFDANKDKLGVASIDETTWKNGEIIAKNTISFQDACTTAYFAGYNLSAYGWYKAPEVSWDEETGQGNAYVTYVYGCQVADITVDTHTGKIVVNKISAAHDVGKAINRLGVEGQIYGGVTQGMGYGVLEHYNIQNGVVKSKNLDEYIIPTIKDIKEISPIIVENPDALGPYGAKSIGEPVLELGAACIANALNNATKKRSYEIPLTLEKVYLGKQLVKPERASEAHKGNKDVKDIIAQVTTLNPKNLNEACQMLANNKNSQLIAGGTDVVIELRGKQTPTTLVNIDQLPELKGIAEKDDCVVIGANQKINEVKESEIVQKHFPALVEAISSIGAKQTRMRGSLAGNIANASPSADSLPPLVAYGAKVLLVSQNGERTIDVDKFIVGGYKTDIKEGEIIKSIILPIPTKTLEYSYFQLGRRGAVNITRLSLLTMCAKNSSGILEDVIISCGALFVKPCRLQKIEELLINQKLDSALIDKAENLLADLIEEQIGGRWSSEYKKPVFINLFKDSLEKFI